MGIAATKTVRRSVARNVNSSFLLGWIFVYLAGSGTRHREGKQDDNERDGQHGPEGEMEGLLEREVDRLIASNGTGWCLEG
jgi:hypothetical protein